MEHVARLCHIIAGSTASRITVTGSITTSIVNSVPNNWHAVESNAVEVHVIASLQW